MSDLRFALRTLLRAPAVSGVLMLSLALGIGANTAIFTILDQILLRGLPVRHPEQLVFFYQPGPVQDHSSTDESGMPSFSYPMFRDLQRQQTRFVGIAGMRAFAASLSYHNQALPGQIHLVSGNYFDLLGMRPASDGCLRRRMTVLPEAIT